MKKEESPGSDDGEYGLSDPDPTLIRSAQSSDPALIPVPAVPLRTCSTCGYPLTGLLSRKCPECGTPFSIAAGRNVTIIPTSEVEDRRAVALDYVKSVLGLIVLGAGILAPWIGPGLTLTVARGVLVSMVNLFFLKHLADYKIASSQAWSEFLFRAGLMTAALSGVVLLVF